MAEQFEDLRAWKTARTLTNHVYALSKKDRFANDWALRDQVRRASISVMSNIAEGFESRTRAQFIDFLGVAKASAGEVRSQLYVAHDQSYLNDEEFESLFGELSTACDFVDLVQNGFFTPPVVHQGHDLTLARPPLQGSFGHRSALRPLCLGYVSIRQTGSEAVSDQADKVSRQLYHLIHHLENHDGSGQVRELSAGYVVQ